MADRRYTDEEAQEILRRALASEQARAEGLMHADLIEAAAEVGIAPEAMARAAESLRIEQAARGVLAERRAGKRRRFWNSLVTFSIVNAGLFALDTLSGGGTWYHWPLLIWGAFLALEGARTFLPKGADAERRALAKEVTRVRADEAREAARRREEERRRARREAGLGLEQAIEDGVAALLGAAAKGIERAIEGRPPRVPGEFERYVDRQRGGPPATAARGAGATPGPVSRGGHVEAGPRSRVDDGERQDGVDAAGSHDDEVSGQRGRARRG